MLNWIPTVLLSVRSITLPFSFRESAKGKIAQCVLNGSVISLYNREILVLVPVIPLHCFFLGRCVYTYPDKEFRLYPGVPRATEHWNHLYGHRVMIERTITLFKDVFALASRKTHNTKPLRQTYIFPASCSF